MLLKYKIAIEIINSEFIKISPHGDWQYFVENSVPADASYLCLKLIEKDTFEVISFNSDGLEILVKDDGSKVIPRYMSLVTSESLLQLEVPFIFLEPLHTEKKRRTDSTVRIVGSNQNGTVQVIWKFVPEMPHDHGSRQEIACGFKGRAWTNLCYENNVAAGCTVVLKFCASENLFTLDVFNSNGIGLGEARFVTTSSSLPNNQLIERRYDEVDDVEVVSHRCRMKNHKCGSGKENSTLIFFHFHSLSTNKLTLPKDFVRDHQLSKYRKAVLKFGEMRFRADLHVVIDKRRVDDLNHVVLKCDW